MDGSGQVWVQGSELVRLDPASGDATTWDAAGDVAFGASSIISAAADSGVWLVEGDRVRLFDGERFAVDLQVPAELFASSAGAGVVGHVHDVVEAGSQLWVSLHDVAFHGQQPGHRVVRWADGQWSVMADSDDGVAGGLTVDTDGNMWAGGMPDTAEGGDQAGVGTGIRRLPRGGSDWTLPASEDPDAPDGHGLVAADPAGGVWVLSLGEEAESSTLHRFDGSSWRTIGQGGLPSLGYPGWGTNERPEVEPEMDAEPGTGMGYVAEYGSSVWLAATADGSAWIASDQEANGLPDSEAMWGVESDGAIRAFGPPQGVIGRVNGLAASGDRALVLDAVGVLGVQGDTATRDWEPPRPEDLPGHDGYADFSLLTAISTDEVWLTSGDIYSADGMGYGTSSWYRYRDGAWQDIGLGADNGCLAVVATDGAVWTTSAQGLIRTHGEDSRVVVSGSAGCAYFPGPDGSVWTRNPSSPGSELAIINPDGSRTAIAPPPGYAAFCFQAAGRDGTAWITSVDQEADYNACSDPSTLSHWDGLTWASVDGADRVRLDEEDAGVGETMVVTDDGATWASLTDSAIGRYADGQWKVFHAGDGDWLLTGAPGGRACAFTAWDYVGGRDQATGIVCFDAGGEIARFDLGVVYDLSVSPEGDVWVLGDQVARLPDRLPTD